MKKWTVMLIPHDRNSTTRTLEASNWHFFAVVGVVALLAFSAAFLFQRQRVVSNSNLSLREAYRSLELQAANRPTAETAVVTTVDDSAVRAAEAKLRAEYEATINTITAELGRLYDMEAKARNITGIAPRRAGSSEEETEVGNGRGGSGGGLGGFGGIAIGTIDSTLRPPEVIYGLSRPSADLIMQEIDLRNRSLKEYVSDAEVEIDRIQRIPSVWPLAGGVGKITSRFGYRRHPVLRRVRHHAGTDIAAKTGTTVLATAKGSVEESTYDKYYGNVIVINHGNGLKTRYAHLSARHVEQGEMVGRDDRIGAVGSTGLSTGPHLHYEVLKRGTAVDSENYLTD